MKWSDLDNRWKVYVVRGVLSGLKLLHIYFIVMTTVFHGINIRYILCNLYTFFIDCSDI